MKQCPETEQDRLNRFICIWGDGTAQETEREGILYLADIPLPIYQEFGFPELHGRKTTTRQTVSSSSPVNAVKKEPVPVATKVVSPYDRQRENMDNWLNGGILMDERKR
ncbi:MAG: hypothetical protein IJ849_12860 [Selenomonadaceae bacterium]|nr:hypothetical protein [Selenomonadaceae bacterium]